MGPALSGIRLTAQKYERRIKYIGMMMIEELPIALAIQRYALDWLRRLSAQHRKERKLLTYLCLLIYTIASSFPDNILGRFH